jgi:small subunit ribosomal protein S16
VADQRKPRDGRFIEIIGHYNPRTEPNTVVVDAERAVYWLQQGAQPSDAVARMFRNLGISAKGVTPQEPEGEEAAEAEASAEETEAIAEEQTVGEPTETQEAVAEEEAAPEEAVSEETASKEAETE